jgi:hypothetical protein
MGLKPVSIVNLKITSKYVSRVSHIGYTLRYSGLYGSAATLMSNTGYLVVRIKGVVLSPAPGTVLRLRILFKHIRG